MRVASEADIGLSWRDAALDASLELSTKILEYGVLDLPVVLNRTPMHERLLGPDYPLFASNEDDVVDAIVDAAGDPSIRADAAARLRAAAAEHTFEQGAERIRAMLDRVHPPPLSAEPRRRRLRIGVASHDLKFFTAILAHLRSLPDVEVRRRPVAPPQQARPGRQPGARRLGGPRHLRVVRTERGLVQPPSAPGPAPDRPPPSLRARRRVAVPGRDRRGRPRGLRERVVRGADTQPDRLAGAEGGRHPELGRRPRPRPTEARWRAVPPGLHRDGTGPQASRPGPRRARIAPGARRTLSPVRQDEADLGLRVDLAQCGGAGARAARDAEAADIAGAARLGGVRRLRAGRGELAAPDRVRALDE